MSEDDVSGLVGRGDLDELVSAIDRLAAQERWEVLVDLRDACRAAAAETGRQLWGPAHFADYRIALAAPAALAASVVVAGSGRFTLGPLTEVVAQAHTFDELVDHLDVTVLGTVAQERVLRGERLDGHDRAELDQLALPGRLQPWEPSYRLPTYRAADRLDGEPPSARSLPQTEAAADPPTRADRAPDTGAGAFDGLGIEESLHELVAPWVTESDGAVRVGVVEGDVMRALEKLEIQAVRVQRIHLPDAFALMASAAASGGAHGRRRGGAAGRAGAWWVGASVVGRQLPIDPDELEFELEDRHWWTFASPQTGAGWTLRLAVSDPSAGWTAVVDAFDPIPVEETWM